MNKKYFLIVLFANIFFFARAQDKIISGTVTSAEDNSTFPGVNVFVKGTTTGTLTDNDGKYRITVPSSADSLVFSFLGMKTQIITITDKTVLNVALQTDAKKLNEVVVTALGIKREKKALGYAVQEVPGTELQTAKDPSFVNQLEGRVAGLNISSTTGGPGSSSRIVLRGPTSLSGDNQALIVIDGVPMENNTNNNTSQWGGRDYGNGISDINPDDIETISVLKGPAAAALYGSKATNGAILITTKKGNTAKGKGIGIGVSFNSSTSFEIAYIHEKFQNTYGAGRNGKFEGPWVIGADSIYSYNTPSAAAYGSWGPKMEGQTIRDWDGKIKSFSPQPDNYKDFFQTGVTTNNNISLEGGNKKITYRAGVGYMNVKDIVPNTTLKRTSISTRITANVTSKLSADLSVNYTNQLANNRLGLADSRSVARNYVMMPRSVSLESLHDHTMDTSGKETTWYTNWNWMTNPFWDIQYELNDDERNRVIGVASATYQFTSHLNLMLRTNVDFNFQNENSREAYKGILNSLGSYSESWSKNKQYQSDFLLTYQNKINTNIFYTANLGGSTFQKQNRITSTSTKNGLVIPYEYNIENSVTTPDTSKKLYESRVNGLYAFGQLSYKTFLFVDLTARNDWSSTLPKNNRSYFYPSISTGFVFTEALKMKEKILSFGKLRASWARVGRDTDPYMLNQTYPYVSSFNGDSMYQVNPVIPLLNLKPEITTNRELGAELMFFNGRIRFDFAYYNSDTRNQIVVADVSGTSGFPKAVINSGEIKNQGTEIQLKLNPVATKNFKWNIDFNYAHNESKVVSLTEGIESYILFSDWNLTVEARPGHPYGDIVGYGIKRDANGNKLVDANGMYVRDDTPWVLGNYNPKYTGGVQNNFSYKSFSFNFLIDYRVGGQMFSGTNMYASGYSGNLKSTLEGREEWYASEAQREAAGVAPEDWVATGGFLADGVTADGSKNKVYVNPEKYWGQFSEWTKEIHEPFVYDASFVKLREVTITYEFSQKIIRKLRLKGLSLALTGRNLWLIYSGVPNIDPESAYTNGNGQGYEKYSYPTRRSFGFNIKVNL